MKLLMITRKVDREDGLAGFTYNWIKKLSRRLDNLMVICLEEGDISGLDNVSIYSLTKKGESKNKYLKLKRFCRFQKLAWRLTPKADGVFCHMNPEYTILISPWAKIFGKKIVSWYTHKAVTGKMKLMERLSDVILTASPESFRLPSKKVKVVGHGIDIDIFKPSTNGHQPMASRYFTILSVGRISLTKDYETLIKAADILRDKFNLKDFTVKIIGESGLTEQQNYFNSLKQMVSKMNLSGKVKFLGSIPNSKVASYYQEADLFVNLSDTGSLDKAVLEAMACGALVLTSNEAFKSILPSELMVEKNKPEALAQKILEVINFDKEKNTSLKNKLRQIVVEDHNLDNLVKKIIANFS